MKMEVSPTSKPIKRSELFKKLETSADPTYPRCFDISSFLGSHIITLQQLDSIFKKYDALKSTAADMITKKNDIPSTFSLDASFGLFYLHTLARTIDLVLRKQGISTFTTDAIYKGSETLSLNIDALIQKTVDIPLTASVDTLFKKLGITKSPQFDAILRAAGTSKYMTVDALLKLLNIPKCFDINSSFRFLNTKPIGIDVDFKKELSKITLINAIFMALYTKSKTIDTLFQKQNTPMPISADTIYKSVDVVKLLVLDTIISLPMALRSFGIDTDILKQSIEASFGIDSRFGILSTIQLSLALDSILKKSDVVLPFTIDSDILKQLSIPIDIDGFIKASVAKDRTIDTVILLPNTPIQTAIDTLIQKLRLSKALSIDTLYGTLNKSRTMTLDEVFKKFDALQSFLADTAYKKSDLSKSLTIDTVINVLTLSSFSVDAVYKSIGEYVQTSIDSVFEIEQLKGFSVDSIFRLIYSLTILVDSITKALNVHSGFSLDVSLGVGSFLRSLGVQALQDDLSDSYTQEPRSESSIETHGNDMEVI
jgi:hypothetical protein